MIKIRKTAIKPDIEQKPLQEKTYSDFSNYSFGSLR